MNDLPEITITSEAEFLAHVIAMKNESEDRLQSMADCLSEHNNPQAAEVFQHMAELITENIQQLESMAAGMELPEIPPWEYQWHCKNDPESICMDQAHYMMTERQSLNLALFNEQRSVNFFHRVNTEVENPEVKKLAQHFLNIEEKFADVIQQRLLVAEDELEPHEDLDPPHMPE